MDFPIDHTSSSKETTKPTRICKSRARPQSNCSPRDPNNVINVSKFRRAGVPPLSSAAALCCCKHAPACGVRVRVVCEKDSPAGSRQVGPRVNGHVLVALNAGISSPDLGYKICFALRSTTTTFKCLLSMILIVRRISSKININQFHRARGSSQENQFRYSSNMKKCLQSRISNFTNDFYSA